MGEPAIIQTTANYGEVYERDLNRVLGKALVGCLLRMVAARLRLKVSDLAKDVHWRSGRRKMRGRAYVMYLLRVELNISTHTICDLMDTNAKKVQRSIIVVGELRDRYAPIDDWLDQMAQTARGEWI